MLDFDAILKPTLVLDEKAALQNIRRMAQKARASGVEFRPHFKTHQSAEIGAWFRDEGINRITVSSLDMAQYFATHGWKDITLAFSLNLRQLAGMNALAQHVRLGLLVESVAAIDALAKALTNPVDLWIKVDIGAQRTGIFWQDEESASLILQRALGSPLITPRGLLTHAGQTYAATSANRAAEIFSTTTNQLHGLRQSLVHRLNIQLQISVGDTPGCSASAAFSPADEIRPGNFVFYDAEQYLMGSCGWQDVAVALACPVVAVHSRRNEVVVYGGAIHLSKDYYIHRDTRLHGLVSLPAAESGQGSRAWRAPLPGAFVDRLSQEHGVLHVPAQSIEQIHPGDLVFLLPAHSCLTAQCMRRYLALDGRWIEMMP